VRSSFCALSFPTNICATEDDPLLPSTILVIFAFLRGVGNIASGPISNSLLAHGRITGAKGGYGVENYVRNTSYLTREIMLTWGVAQGSLLLYTGLMMAAGSAVGVAYREQPASAARGRAPEDGR
jgi:hypothetical protein